MRDTAAEGPTVAGGKGEGRYPLGGVAGTLKAWLREVHRQFCESY